MAYNATYGADDLSPAVIDGLVQVIVAVVAFASLIGLALIYAWFKKKGLTKV